MILQNNLLNGCLKYKLSSCYFFVEFHLDALDNVLVVLDDLVLLLDLPLQSHP